MAITYGEILLRLFLASFIGFCLGMEREYNKKSVGARTYIIVAVFSCCVAIASTEGFVTGTGMTNDPARLAVGILTGIGFLGAGIIWQDHKTGSTQGITTASEMFALACLSIVIGMGMYFLGLISFVLIFSTLVITTFIRVSKKKRRLRELGEIKNTIENIDIKEKEYRDMLEKEYNDWDR